MARGDLRAAEDDGLSLRLLGIRGESATGNSKKKREKVKLAWQMEGYRRVFGSLPYFRQSFMAAIANRKVGTVSFPKSNA
jgi:hypothetical protein